MTRHYPHDWGWHLMEAAALVTAAVAAVVGVVRGAERDVMRWVHETGSDDE